MTAEALIAQVVAWAGRQSDIRAVALVGSYARGSAHADSDIDLVLLCVDPARYLKDAARMNHKAAAVIGGLFLAPFIATNAIVAHRIEPFFSFIRPGLQTSPFEYVLQGIIRYPLFVG